MKMDVPALQDFLTRVFPQVADDFEVITVTNSLAKIKLKISEKHLRPGGTVSGPSMFGLADVSAYLLILAQVGPKALAVTTNCSIDFMRKPVSECDLIAECRLLKLGKSLAVTDCLLYSEGDVAPVARASLTYSLPPF